MGGNRIRNSASARPASAGARRRVLVLSQHSYHHTTLHRNTETLLRAGVEVDQVCTTDHWELGTTGQPGLRRYGIPLLHRRTLVGYPLEYAGFFLWALLAASWLGLRRRYDAVQVDTLPDVLVFSAVVPRIRGARILLYVYDLMPEMVASKLRCGPRHPLVRVFARMEVWSTSWADHVITVSDLFKRVMGARGLDGGKVTLVANSHPVEDVPYVPLASPPWLVCQTILIERYGVQVAIRALAELKDGRPELQLKVLGQGEQQGGSRSWRRAWVCATGSTSPASGCPGPRRCSWSGRARSGSCPSSATAMAT